MSQGDITQAQNGGDVSRFFGGQAFDPNSVEPAEDFTVLPAGDYPALIEDTDVKATKAGNGHYFEFQFVVTEGPAKGRKLWDRMNIDNPNPKAVAIAQRSLSALVNATIGAVPFGDTDQLKHKACVLVLKVKDGENSIRTYKALPGVQLQAPAQPQQQPVQQQPVQQPQQPMQQQPMQQQNMVGPPPVVQGTHGVGAMQAPLVNQQQPMQQQPVQQQPVQQQPVQQQPGSNPVGSEPWS